MTRFRSRGGDRIPPPTSSMDGDHDGLDEDDTPVVWILTLDMLMVELCFQAEESSFRQAHLGMFQPEFNYKQYEPQEAQK